MNMRVRVCLGLLLAQAASQASGQPALERVEKLVQRAVQSANGGQPAAPAHAQPGSKQPGYLGVVADDRQDVGRGARVLEVVAGGPAAKGGLQVKDLITAVGNEPVRSLDDMTNLLALRPAGAVVVFSVTRDGSRGKFRSRWARGRRPTNACCRNLANSPSNFPTARPAAGQSATRW